MRRLPPRGPKIQAGQPTGPAAPGDCGTLPLKCARLTGEQLCRRAYRAEIAAAKEAAARHAMDDLTQPRPGRDRFSLRWVYAHMLEEYARHNGHADLLREAVDGQTGE